MPGGTSLQDLMPSIATADPRRQALENIIHDEPDRVAAHLRQSIDFFEKEVLPGYDAIAAGK